MRFAFIALGLLVLGCATPRSTETASPPPVAAPPRVAVPAPPIVSPPPPPRSGDASVPRADTVPPAVDGARRDAARSLVEQGRTAAARDELSAAVVVLREAVGLDPRAAAARAALGQALYDLGDYDGAVDELRLALRQDPDAVAPRLRLASALIARRDWPAARAELEDVLKRAPESLDAYYRLGLVRYAQGDLPGAIAAYRHVVEGDPRNADARYNLALVLKLARRDAEATPEFVAAAEAGLPRAQYFAGSAYATGAGVGRDLARAIGWYFRAADGGVPQAHEALAQLRQTVLGRGRRTALERQAIQQAFREYRESLWSEHADLVRQGDDTLGAALLREGRDAAATAALLREASALGESAEAELAALYERTRDARILEWFKAAAVEGNPRARRFLQEQSAR